MKKLIYIILAIITLIILFKPFAIKAIQQQTDQCTKDMLQNKEIICD